MMDLEDNLNKFEHLIKSSTSVEAQTVMRNRLKEALNRELVSVKYLNMVREQYGLKTDNQASELIEVTRTIVSGYRKGRYKMGEEVALRVAGLLKIDPKIILLELRIENAPNPEVMAVWGEVLKKIAEESIDASDLEVSTGDHSHPRT